MFDLWANGQGTELAAFGLVWTAIMTVIAAGLLSCRAADDRVRRARVTGESKWTGSMDLEASKRKVAALTEPRNVVLVGASDRPGSWAARVWRNLQAIRISGAGLSGQSAPHGNLGRALLSGFPVAAGAARSSGRAGAGGRRAGRVAQRRRCRRAQRHRVFVGFRRGVRHPSGARLGRELSGVIAATGLAVSGPNCMGNICAKSRLVTLTEDGHCGCGKGRWRWSARAAA